MWENLGPAIAVTALAAMTLMIVRTVMSNRRLAQVAKLQAEMQTRLLEKFGSAQEVVSYLQSEAGQKFLESATIERGNPYRRILGSIQAGLILTLVGVAFLYLRGPLPEGAEGFVFIGALGLALGVGFLLSAGVAYALSKSWGLIDGAQGGGGS